MANWSDLKAAIASIVKTNGNKEITGQLLQNVLNNIISNVGLNSTFAGIATPETNPGTPDGNVFYLATTAGTYSNFNGIVIKSGEAVILEWKGSWVKKDSGFATEEKLSELGSKIEVYISSQIRIDFIDNGLIVGEGWLFQKGISEKKIEHTSLDLTGMEGLVYIVYGQNGIYATMYNVELESKNDVIICIVDIAGKTIQCNCRSLIIGGKKIVDFTEDLNNEIFTIANTRIPFLEKRVGEFYNSDSPNRYITSDISINFNEKLLTYSNGYIFNGRVNRAYTLNSGSVELTQSNLSYIVYSFSEKTLYVKEYFEELNDAKDILVGVIIFSTEEIYVTCRNLTINGVKVAKAKDLSEVSILPKKTIFPNLEFPSKVYNSNSGSDGIFWDVRNKIGRNAKLLNINVKTNGSGIVRIHYIDESNNTVYYEDHEVVYGVNTFKPTTEIDYTKNLWVGFQNLSMESKGVLLIYPTDNSGQSKKKFLLDGSVVNQTYPHALWLDVISMEETLPYRVSELEKQSNGIKTFEDLRNALSLGIEKIELGECDITIESALIIPKGTKITGVRGKSIIRVPSNVLIGLDLRNVEDVIIEGITLVGAYNGTPLKTGLQPVKSGIINTVEDAYNWVGAGYQTDATNGGVTDEYIPQIGININTCEKVEIIGCEIKNFSWAGINNRMSGKNYRYAIKAENNYINNCYCGIKLYDEAERSQYIANNIALCQIGVYLDSGTNMFNTTSLTANRIGMVMHNGWNHAHGEFTDCPFTHCSLFSILCVDLAHGQVFNGCKIGYVDAEEGNFGGFCCYIKDSRGFMFNNGKLIQAHVKIEGKHHVNGESVKTSDTTDQFGNYYQVVTYSETTPNGIIKFQNNLETSSASFNLGDGLGVSDVILKDNVHIDGSDDSDINNYPL